MGVHPGWVDMGVHVQALLGQGRQSLHAVDGHHVGEDIFVEGEANHVLSTARHTVALHAKNEKTKKTLALHSC